MVDCVRGHDYPSRADCRDCGARHECGYYRRRKASDDLDESLAISNAAVATGIIF